MGKSRLVSIIRGFEQTERDFKTQLEITPPGDYRVQHPIKDRAHTIWLLRDYSVSTNLPQQGDDTYYICYQQQYKNENPFHLFDENKPAWIEHTTTPQTLISAMINITRPGWPEKPFLCDPFAGTGTTILESLKFPDLTVIGRDASHLSKLVCTDNYDFFTAAPLLLTELKSKIQQTILNKPWKKPQPRIPSANEFSFFLSIANAFIRFETRNGDFTLNPNDEKTLARILGSLTFTDRIIVYLRLRAIRRRIGAFHRGTLDWDAAYNEEARQLLREIELLEALKRGTPREQRDDILVVQGRYSGDCTFSAQMLAERWKQNVTILTGKVETLGRKRFDVIIADPPYGFNSEKEAEELATMYCKAIKKIINALKDGGQLVIALPEKSYIGRRSPSFTHKEIVSQQILDIGAQSELAVMTRSVPEPTRLYRPPYYWRSEKALARSILHFRFKKTSKAHNKRGHS